MGKRKTEWMEYELEYLCRFIETDGAVMIAHALNRMVRDVHAKVAELKQSGRYEYYKKLKKHWCC